MSYRFLPGSIYRMPTHFGPAPGPRQRYGGGRWECRDTPLVTSLWVSYLTDADRLASHLPPGFALSDEPKVTVEARYLRNVEWLGGRGYNIVAVYFDTVYVAADDPIPGRLQAVVWENSPDAVLTGREELGIPKLYAEIPDPPELDMGEMRCSVAWDGYTFLTMAVGELADGESPDAGGLPTFHYRYLPRTGEWGRADVSDTVVTPASTPNRRTLRERMGTGTVTVSAGSWQDLPTLVHIVAGLAELEPLAYVGAGARETVGGKDLRDQHRLEVGVGV